MAKSKYPSNWLNDPLFEYRKHKTTGKIQRRKKYRRDPFGGQLNKLEGTRGVLNVQRDVATGPDPSKIVSSGAIFRAERQARKERRLLEAREAEGLPPGGLEEAARLRAEERGLGRQLDAEGRMVERQKAAELRGEGLRVGAEGRRAGREELEAQDAADAAMASITAGGDPALHADAVQIRREMAAISDAIAKHGKRIGAADMGQLQAKQVELGKRLGSIAREAQAAKTALGEGEDVAAEEQRVKEVAEKRAFKKEDDRVARVFKLNDQLLKIDEEINTLEAKKKTVDQDPTLGLVSDIDAQIKAKEISRKTVQGWLDEAQGGGAETGDTTDVVPPEPESVDKTVEDIINRISGKF